MLRLAIPGFTALLVLAALSLWLTNRVATAEALRAATQVASVMARAAIEPQLADAGTDPDKLDPLVREQLLVEPVVAVRIWEPDGTIAYATEPRLIGERFALADDEREILEHGGVESEVSDLTKPENRYEQGFGQLVEVYLPVTDDRGNRYLFEVYTRQSAIDEAARNLMLAFAPVVAGSLVILTGVLIALAYRMARRVQRESRDRERLLHRALDASETERRRIAADLHDGVVQDLVGVSYTLAALSDAADRAGDPGTHARLADTATSTRRAVRSLRSLLVDIYPQSLTDAGLTAAVGDLVAGLPSSIAGHLRADEPVSLPPEQQAALYRAAREALQNVAKHSRATMVTVTIEPRPGGALLRVVDDGVGFDPGTPTAGHLGLQLLRDLAAAVDGRCTVRSQPGSGTTVEFEVGQP